MREEVLDDDDDDDDDILVLPPDADDDGSTSVLGLDDNDGRGASDDGFRSALPPLDEWELYPGRGHFARLTSGKLRYVPGRDRR